MNFRWFPGILILIVILVAALAGCTSPTPSQTPVTPVHSTVTADNAHPISAERSSLASPMAQKESISGQLASVQSTNPIFLEAYRMFRNIKATEYVHPPYTDNDMAGIYKFDCLGFVDHVLMNVSSDSYKEIGKGANPSIESYSTYFDNLDTATPDTLGWTKVSRPIDLKPGDICLWLKPSTLDTGHMWIVAGTPSVNPERSKEVLVRIFDSSVAHSDDSRTGSAFRTGLGSGILGYMIDGQGSPTGLYWDGGMSTSVGEMDTTIICGRLNR